MTNAHKLTDTQLRLLSQASQRRDGLLAPPAPLKGGAAKATTARLLALALVEEVTVTAHDPHWRVDDERAVGLKLTQAGLAALGLEPEAGQADIGMVGEEAHAEPETEGAAAPATRPIPRAGTKRAQVVALLSREGGATLGELTAATGWLAHTTRAALTGLRQSGHTITSTRGADRRLTYRIASLAAEQQGIANQQDGDQPAAQAGAAVGETR